MAGLRLRLHPLFLLLGAVLVFMGSGYTFLSYTVTVIIHEMGHSSAAARYGYVLDDINLMPYGAVLSGKIEGIPAKDEIIIALAGPATNFVTAIIFTAVWWLVPSSYFFTQVFVISNIVTAAFNLLPVFPLDGGRVLLAALSTVKPYDRALKTVRVVGAVFAAVFATLFIASFFVGFNITVGILAVFIFVSTFAAAKSDGYMRVYNQTFLSKNIKKGVAVKEMAVFDTEPLISILKKITANNYYRFLVLDGTLQTLGVLTQSQAESCAAYLGAHASIGDALKSLKQQP